jgi:hypothetical protein
VSILETGAFIGASGTSGPAARSVFVPKGGHRAHPEPEIFFAHPLVGRMSIFAWQSKAHEENRRAEYALEVADDGDGAAFAGDYGFLPECRA